MSHDSEARGQATEASLLTTESLQIGYTHQGASTTIASNLSLELKAGEFVCLLGPNGAGKSTLIRTLAGMQPALGGQVTLQGQSFQQIAPRERARQVSVVLTESMPIGMMDAYSLVSLGRHPYSGWLGGLNQHDRERIAWALNAVGATELAPRQVAELSDGERQKVSIARALAQEAKVMLLDEPTAYLDLPRRVELMSILRTLAQQEQMALLLSTHDLDLALRFADKLWVVTTEGTLLQGSPEALALSGEFADVFANENLEWDAEHGLFRAPKVPCLQVYIQGDGHEYLWTRRAVERLGFGIGNPDTAAFSVKVAKSQWLVQRNDSPIALNSIQAFIDWIKAQDWAQQPTTNN